MIIALIIISVIIFLIYKTIYKSEVSFEDINKFELETRNEENTENDVFLIKKEKVNFDASNGKTVYRETQRETKPDEVLYPNPRQIRQTEAQIMEEFIDDDFDIIKDAKECQEAEFESSILQEQEKEYLLSLNTVTL